MSEEQIHAIRITLTRVPEADRFNLVLEAHPPCPDNGCTDIAELMLRSLGVTAEMVNFHPDSK